MKYLFLLLFYLNITPIYSQAPAILWQNRIGGFNRNVSYSSQNTTDGGFIIGGRSDSNISGDKTENSRGAYDYWLIKTNSEGVVEWDKTIGAASPNGSEQDWFYDIQQTTDGGYIVCGYSDAPISGDKTESAINNSPDFWIVKTNSLGIVQWQNVIGGYSDDVPTSIELTTDGGYIIGGYSDSNISGDKTENSRGGIDYWVMKLNNSGSILWQKTLGGTGIDVLNSVIQTSDGGFLVGGQSNSNISGDKTENSKGGSDMWIIKLNTNGSINWQKTIGGSDFDKLVKIIQTSDGGYFLTGYSISPISGDKTDSCRGSYDFWVVKIDMSGNILWDKTIGGSGNDGLLSTVLSYDGGFLLLGSSDSPISGEKTLPIIGSNDAWVVKINSIGGIIWQKNIGGLLDDVFNSVSQTLDGGYFLSGVTNSPVSGNITQNPKGIYDYWILKLAPEDLATNQNSINTFEVYPNPTDSNINIHFVQTQGKINVTVNNILGQKIFDRTFSQIETTTIPITSENGIYLLTIENEKGEKKTVKVIKQ